MEKHTMKVMMYHGEEFTVNAIPVMSSVVGVLLMTKMVQFLSQNAPPSLIKQKPTLKERGKNG